MSVELSATRRAAPPRSAPTLLLPHGLLELTIVFVAAGAGLRLGWSWIAPGPRTRWQALATEGRAIGTVVWLAFLTYVFTLGRRAARAGERGDVAEELVAPVPTEAA